MTQPDLRTMSDANPSTRIHEAILAIMQEVEPIAKSLRNDQQKFNYRGIDQVYNAVHPLFAKHGVYTTSTILEMHHDAQPSKSGGTNRFAVLKMRYTFRASDGSEVFTEVVGEGMDSGDKANNKAMSVAAKYALLQILMIPTAMVDPDAPERREAPERDPDAPQTGTRAERAATGDREQQLATLSESWQQTQKNLPDDPAMKRGKFFAWVQKIVGRNGFNPGKLADWTDEDVRKCRAALE
jgi:hypothetical protein